MRKKRPIVKSKAYARSRYEAGQAAKKKKAAKKAAKAAKAAPQKAAAKKAPAKKKPKVTVIDTSKPASAADKKIIQDSRRKPASPKPAKTPAKAPTKANEKRKKVESILTDPTKTQGQKYLARIRLGLMKDSSKRNAGRRSRRSPRK